MTSGRRNSSKNRHSETASVSCFYYYEAKAVSGSALALPSLACGHDNRTQAALWHAGGQQLFRDPVLKSVMKLPQDWAIC
jgi:hypothetical protein